MVAVMVVIAPVLTVTLMVHNGYGNGIGSDSAVGSRSSIGNINGV